MIDYFKDKDATDFPGRRPYGPTSDIATWRSLYTNAKELIDNCVLKKRLLGWLRIGSMSPECSDIYVHERFDGASH